MRLYCATEEGALRHRHTHKGNWTVLKLLSVKAIITTQRKLNPRVQSVTVFKLLCVKAHDSSGQCNVCLCGVAASSLPLPSPIASNTIFRRLVQDSLISGMHWNVQRCKGASLRVQTISDATLKEIKLQHAHHNSESTFQLTSKCGYSTPVHILLLIFGG